MVPLMFVLPDLQYLRTSAVHLCCIELMLVLVALPSGQPVPAILLSAVGGSSGGAFGLMVPLLVSIIMAY